jgi:uronate dehydrogenase
MQGEVVLVTGAAGMIATAIRPFLGDEFGRRVRLVDTRPVTGLDRHEESMTGDLHNPNFRRNAFADVVSVVHLTGLTANATPEAHFRHNVELVNDLIVDAQAAGVRRIALASTMHVLGMYRRNERIDLHSAPRPDSAYAESKVAMEQLARRHALDGNLRICCVRIGCFKVHRRDSEPCSWIGAEDLARLFKHVLAQPEFVAPVVHAVAPYWGDDSGQSEMRRVHGFRFRNRGGLAWKDRMLLRRWYPNQAEARTYRGGVFAWATINGVPVP